MIRRLMIALPLLAAAPTASAATATYADLVWSTTPTTWTWNGRTVRSVLPRSPVGIVWAFHGTGGTSDFVDSPEMQFVLQVLLDRGYGFVAMDSKGSQWDIARGPATNVDWPYVDGLRKKLIADGKITSSTPAIALGFSNGGAFASWVGTVAPGKGWPLKSLVLHNSAGWNDAYRSDLPNLPIAFVPSKNDDVILLSDVKNAYDRQVSLKRPSAYLLNPEQDLVPTRFDRSPYLDRTDSLRLFDAMVKHGWYDTLGHRTWTGDANRFLDVVIPGAKDMTPLKPTKAVMAAVLAVHAVNSGHAYDEADFVDAHL